ncbi:MAG: hypothetical protein ABII22_01715 [Candidatus Micrarchaeota archaeon]
MVWEELEDEFTKTCKLLLGTELTGLDEYGPWLGKRVPLPYPVKSTISGKEVWVAPPSNFAGMKFSNVISYDEMEYANKSPFGYEDIKNSGMKEVFQNVMKPVSHFTGNFRYKNYENVDKCSGAGAGRNLYYGEDLFIDIKNAAYSNYAMFSTNIFGCHNVPYSQFCIHCYNSVNLTRAFECDGCYHSSDILFCHNSEALSNCMFCFNTKNKRYAIANVEVGREEYLRVKKILLDYIGKELKEKKYLETDIYSIAKQVF